MTTTCSLASLPGCRRNSLATFDFKLNADVTSHQLQHLIQAVNIGLVHVDFSSCGNGAFLVTEATVSCRVYICTTEVKHKLFEPNHTEAYTAWSSNHYRNEMGVAMMFQCIMQLEYTVRLSCDVTMFWNLIGIANFLAAEVTVWIRRSCQAISPTAWEIGMRPLKCFLTSTRSWGCWLSLATCSPLPRQQDKQRGNFPEFKLYTDVTSRQSHYLRISEYQTSARVGYDFPAVENWVFLCNARTSSERGGGG